MGDFTGKGDQFEGEGDQRTELLEEERTVRGRGYQNCDQCSVTTGGDHRNALFGRTVSFTSNL